jgi:hypothetical protein
MSKLAKPRSTTALLVAAGMVTTSLVPLAMPAPTLAQGTFSDVQSSWARDCITELTRKGIISGYPDGSFRPDAPVTRAEFASMVGKAFPNAARVRTAARFVDVPSNYWAFSAISVASQTGFLSGYPGGVFNPSQNIPRAQVLVSLTSGLNYTPTQPVNATLASFSDASAIPTYAQTGIAAATEKRLVVNYPNVQLLNPNQLSSRAEVSAFLCQALVGTGQVAEVVPAQYIAGGGAVAQQQAQVVAGTPIRVKYAAAQKVVVAPNETADLTLTVVQNVRNSQGTIAIPVGSQIIGQLQPVNGGSQFVARTLVINGQQYALNASSNVIGTTRDARDPNLLKVLGGAALGSGAAALITGLTGNRHITAGNVLLGTTIGGAAAANQGRNVGSAIRDAAIGAAISAGVSGLTGNRTITPKKVITGAAAGATLGGIVDPGGRNVIVIDPNSDLTLQLNQNLNL